MSGFVEELEANARGRFVRWHPGLWQELLDGPARKLAEGLEAENTPPEDVEALLRTYLQLGAEGIGLGYLYPASSGRQNVFTLAWSDLLPRLLPSTPGRKRAAVLAQLWNLGENLESAPPWVQRVFYRVGKDLRSLADLESRLRDVSAAALEPPTKKLGEKAQAHLIDLSREDSRFLPGALHFLSPTVVCVHDRHRKAAGGREASTQGVWLAETPMALGVMGCRETPEVTREYAPVMAAATSKDPRVDTLFSTVLNDWRVAMTMMTSQWLVVLVPR